MKKLLSICAFLLSFTSVVWAAKQPTYLEEVESLGYVAGHGLACHAKKYHKFELLARAIMISKSPSAELQRKAMKVYNTAKAEAFISVGNENFEDCKRLADNFDNQKIFQSVLYSDGRIKLYDGTLITPRKPYDASKLYKKNPYAYKEALATYEKSLDLAKKNAKNAKKIPLKDSNYSRYANQFN